MRLKKLKLFYIRRQPNHDFAAHSPFRFAKVKSWSQCKIERVNLHGFES